MEIPLDLSKHCIQTEIRRLYTKTIGACFRQTVDPDEVEERIETLRDALECFDFGVLRSKYRSLCGGASDCRIVLVKNPAGRICISINGDLIEP